MHWSTNSYDTMRDVAYVSRIQCLLVQRASDRTILTRLCPCQILCGWVGLWVVCQPPPQPLLKVTLLKRLYPYKHTHLTAAIRSLRLLRKSYTDFAAWLMLFGVHPVRILRCLILSLLSHLLWIKMYFVGYFRSIFMPIFPTTLYRIFRLDSIAPNLIVVHL